MRLILVLVLVLALLFPLAAAAAPADLTITFDAPAVGANQKPIASYTVMQDCAGTPMEFIAGITGPGTHAGVLETGQSYSLCLVAIDEDGRVGPPSNVVTLNLVDVVPPGAPENFSIQVQCSDCLVTIQGQ